MTDWVETERRKRIEEGEAKYGPFTYGNFRATGRTGLGEALPEALDIINYYEIAYLGGEISAGEYQYHKAIQEGEAEWIKRRVT